MSGNRRRCTVAKCGLFHNIDETSQNVAFDQKKSLLNLESYVSILGILGKIAYFFEILIWVNSREHALSNCASFFKKTLNINERKIATNTQMRDCINEKTHKQSWEAQMKEHTKAKTQQKS